MKDQRRGSDWLSLRDSDWLRLTSNQHPCYKQDLLMKDPCQHLNFENLKKSGKISFWIKHTGQMEQEPCSLIVANLTYRAATGGDSEQVSSHSSSKRTELRLPLVKPVQVGSKCATGKLKF